MNVRTCLIHPFCNVDEHNTIAYVWHEISLIIFWLFLSFCPFVPEIVLDH